MKTLLTFAEFTNESYSQENELIGNEDLELDQLFTEAVKRSAAEVMKSAEMAIQNQIARYSELMKTNPEKADVYKAQLDLVHAKQTVLAMKKKLAAVKAK
jgi:hypothetical protein